MSGFPILLVCLVASAVWPSRTAVNARNPQWGSSPYDDNYNNYHMIKKDQWGNIIEETVGVSIPYQNPNTRSVYVPHPKTDPYQNVYPSPTNNGLVKREGNKWIIKVAFFALPSLFKMDPEELREDLEASLQGLDDWLDILSGPDFSVEFDRSLHILDDNKISIPTEGDRVSDYALEAVMKKPQVTEVEALFKVLLVPVSITIIQDGTTVNGYAYHNNGRDLSELSELHAFAIVHTSKSWKESITREKGIKRQYPIDYSKIRNKVGVVMHELGHMLGAAECGGEDYLSDQEIHDDVMCSGHGKNFGPGRREIRCRLFQDENC